VKRGDCNFANKVKNAQIAGAKGMIIYNNYQTSNDIEDIIMAEIGYDSDLVIPSVLIDMDSGDVLVE